MYYYLKNFIGERYACPERSRDLFVWPNRVLSANYIQLVREEL